MKKRQSTNNLSNENIELYIKIEKKRKELRLTFAEMAEQIKVPISTLTSAIYSLKAGNNVTIGTIRMIEKSLGASFFFEN